LSVYTGTLAIGPSLYGNVGYDPATDFEPIGRIGRRRTPWWCILDAGALGARADRHPGNRARSITAPPASHGQPRLGEYFATVAGVKITTFPTRDRTGDHRSLGGHSDASLRSPHARERQDRKAANARRDKRSAIGPLPEVPTIAGSPLPGFEAVAGAMAWSLLPARRMRSSRSSTPRSTVLASQEWGAAAIEGAERCRRRRPNRPTIDRGRTQWVEGREGLGAKAE